MPFKDNFGQKLARDVIYYQNCTILRFENNCIYRQSCRLPDSPIRGVVFRIWISPRIRSQNWNGRKFGSLPCPFKTTRIWFQQKKYFKTFHACVTLKRDKSIDTTFNPPLFSLVNTFKSWTKRPYLALSTVSLSKVYGDLTFATFSANSLLIGLIFLLVSLSKVYGDLTFATFSANSLLMGRILLLVSLSRV